MKNFFRCRNFTSSIFVGLPALLFLSLMLVVVFPKSVFLMISLMSSCVVMYPFFSVFCDSIS